MHLSPKFWRFKLRPFKWDDLYTVQALLNIIAEHEQDPYVYSLEWLYFVLEQSGINAECNCFVAMLETNRIIGYSRIESNDDMTQYRVSAGAHPNFEGIGVGQGLIMINDFNLLSIHPPNQPLTIIRQSFRHNTNSSKLLTRLGYRQTSVDDNNHIVWEKHLC